MINIESEVGERFSLWLAWRELNGTSLAVTEAGTGKVVTAAVDGHGRASFATTAGRNYSVTLS
jgi:hypothetical protein